MDDYMVVEFSDAENLILFNRHVVGRLDVSVNGEFVERALNEALGKQRAAIEAARVAED